MFGHPVFEWWRSTGKKVRSSCRIFCTAKKTSNGVCVMLRLNTIRGRYGYATAGRSSEAYRKQKLQLNILQGNAKINYVHSRKRHLKNERTKAEASTGDSWTDQFRQKTLKNWARPSRNAAQIGDLVVGEMKTIGGGGEISRAGLDTRVMFVNGI
jgi:hypothetical protein